MADTKGHQFDPDSDSLSFPDDTVVGIMDDPEGANAAVEVLLATGVTEDGIQVMCCDAGARRLDPTGERHGLLGQLHRIVQLFGDQEVAHVKRQAAALEAGKFLIAASAGTEEEAEKVADTLKSNGGHFINWYTSMTVRRIGA
jgi:hypothetical protein